MSKFLLCRAVTLLVGFILVANYPQSVWATEQPVGQPVVTKLIQAIEDEIYAKGYQTRYGDLGEPGSHGVHRIAVYVQPLISKGRGWIVYKLMPFGEIYRMYSISADGEVRLHGDPSIGFPPTQPTRSASRLCRISTITTSGSTRGIRSE